MYIEIFIQKIHLCILCNGIDFVTCASCILLKILTLGCNVFISASPRMQWYCRLVMKNSAWTRKFAVGPIDMGNRESRDPIKPKFVNKVSIIQ